MKVNKKMNAMLNKMFNIPKWMQKGSPADEMAALDKRFEGRNSAEAVATKEALAKASFDKQEYVKQMNAPAQPEQPQAPMQEQGMPPQEGAPMDMQALMGGEGQPQAPQGGQQFAAGGVVGDYYGSQEESDKALAFNQGADKIAGTVASVNPLVSAGFAATSYLMPKHGKVGNQFQEGSETFFKPWRTDQFRKENKDFAKERYGNKSGMSIVNRPGSAVLMGANPMLSGAIMKKYKTDVATSQANQGALLYNNEIEGKTAGLGSSGSTLQQATPGAMAPQGTSNMSAYGGKINKYANGGPVNCGGEGQPPCKNDEEAMASNRAAMFASTKQAKSELAKEDVKRNFDKVSDGFLWNLPGSVAPMGAGAVAGKAIQSGVGKLSQYGKKGYAAIKHWRKTSRANDALEYKAAMAKPPAGLGYDVAAGTTFGAAVGTGAHHINKYGAKHTLMRPVSEAQASEEEVRRSEEGKRRVPFDYEWVNNIRDKVKGSTNENAYGGKVNKYALGGSLCGGPGQLPCPKQEKQGFDWAGLAGNVIGAAGAAYGAGAFGSGTQASTTFAHGGAIDPPKGQRMTSEGMVSDRPESFQPHVDNRLMSRLKRIQADQDGLREDTSELKKFYDAYPYMDKQGNAYKYGGKVNQYADAGVVQGPCGGAGQPECQPQMGDFMDTSAQMPPVNQPIPKPGYSNPYLDATGGVPGGLAAPGNPAPPKQDNFLGKAADWAGRNYDNIGMGIPLLNAFQKFDQAPSSRTDRLNPNYVKTETDLAAQTNLIRSDASAQRRALAGSSVGSATAMKRGATAIGANTLKAVSGAYRAGEAINRAESDKAQSYALNVGKYNSAAGERDAERAAQDFGAVTTARSANRAAVMEDLVKGFEHAGNEQTIKTMFGYTRKGKYWYKPSGEKATDAEIRTANKEMIGYAAYQKSLKENK